MHRFIFWTLLGLCVSLTGCQDSQTLPENAASNENSSSEATARFCYIARIGNLAQMPEDVWDTTPSPNAPSPQDPQDPQDSQVLQDSQDSQSHPNAQSVQTPETRTALDFESVPDVQSALVSSAVAEEVNSDFLSIVESAASETTTNEGIRSANQKDEELNLAIEMVEEDTEVLAESAKTETPAATSKGKARAKANSNSEDEDKVVISMDGNEAETAPAESADEESADEDDETDESEETDETTKTKEDTEIAEATEDIEDAEDTETEAAVSEDSSVETVPSTEENTEEKKTVTAPKVQDSSRIEEELDRQAEAFVELAKAPPQEVQKEIRDAHFQNVSIRLMKIPGSLISGKAGSDYYVIRTMEYSGSNLAKDFRVLTLSRNYSQWLKDLEQYLDIITLDDMHHEYWVEVPEFWNSSAE